MGIDYGRAKTYTVGNWLISGTRTVPKSKMRPSTYPDLSWLTSKTTSQPQLGKIPLNRYDDAASATGSTRNCWRKGG